MRRKRKTKGESVVRLKRRRKEENNRLKYNEMRKMQRIRKEMEKER
jgi:hypothetical protein